MKLLRALPWPKLCLINLAIVALLGVVMRYKIGFSLPFLDQKNLQHAHSHFAFTGWVTLLLMVLLSRATPQLATVPQPKYWQWGSQLGLSYAMLVAFAAGGYSPLAIVLSTLSIGVFYWFAWSHYRALQQAPASAGKPWVVAALFFGVLSTLGTFYLSYQTATKSLVQGNYLASVYWYLHFQYNGWFFFAIMGLFLDDLEQRGIRLHQQRLAFWLLALSAIPAYGLSVLWSKLSLPFYLLTALAAVAQAAGWVLLLRAAWAQRTALSRHWKTIHLVFFAAIALAISIKLGLQLGSTLPAISKLAFGFRPIVIAYLHLVFLGITSSYLLIHLCLQQVRPLNGLGHWGLIGFLVGVGLNELVLAIQGIGAIGYHVIPWANPSLLAITGILALSSLALAASNLGDDFSHT